jgi:hypothetical protein
MVSDITGRKTGGVSEQGAENIWTKEGWGDRKVEKTTLTRSCIICTLDQV